MKTEQPILVDNGTDLVHRVWEPTGTAPHPTVLMVHGRSGTEDVTWVFARALPKEWLLVAPRAIYADSRGGYSWHVNTEEENPTPLDLAPAVESLSHFVERLPALYGADLSRLYILSFSQGAALSYLYAMRHRARVQGLVGLVGFMADEVEDSAEINTLKDLPVMMAVGRQDTTITVPQAQRCAQLLIQAGAQLNYHEYNTGHKLNAQGMRDLTAWWRARS